MRPIFSSSSFRMSDSRLATRARNSRRATESSRSSGVLSLTQCSDRRSRRSPGRRPLDSRMPTICVGCSLSCDSWAQRTNASRSELFDGTQSISTPLAPFSIVNVMLSRLRAHKTSLSIVLLDLKMLLRNLLIAQQSMFSCLHR